MPLARSAVEEIHLAEQLDAGGAHDQAVNALARASSSGSHEAMTRLAKRLIVGDRAPLLPKDGVGLLIDAANLGNAEAAARLAVLHAAGAYVVHSLVDALQLLVVAAERGWQSARSQLQLLSSADDEIAPDRPMPDAHWHRLAKAIDIDYWVAATQGRDLNDSPLIRVFPDFVPSAICRWLVQRCSGRLERALVYDPVGGKEIAEHTRTNTAASFNLMEVELIQLLIQLRMAAACGFPLQNMEAPTVLHYDVGEQITNHFDFVNPKIPNYDREIEKNGQRVLTFLIYLNDDYTGGETLFPRLGVRHKGRAGEGLFFVNALKSGEPDLRTVHAGCPPQNGEKWVVSQFVRGRRVLGA